MITAFRHYVFLASWHRSANPSYFAFRKHCIGDDKKESEVNQMIMSTIITAIFIIGGCLILLQVYDLIENETLRTLLIAGYGVFTVFLVFRLLTDYFISQLSTLI